MPIRGGAYGEWGRGHPPACTCYDCNEGKRRSRSPRGRPRNRSPRDQPAPRLPSPVPWAVPGSRSFRNRSSGTPPTTGGKNWTPLLLLILICGIIGSISYTADCQSWRSAPGLVASRVATPEPTPAPEVAPGLASPIPSVPRATVDPMADPLGDPYYSRAQHRVTVNVDAAIVEQKVIDFTNDERLRLGLEPLIHDSAVSSIARAHSSNMLRQGTLSHRLDGKNPTRRAKDAGFDCQIKLLADGQASHALAENIAKHPQPQSRDQALRAYGWIDEDFMSSDAAARRLVYAWMNSPGHRRNITDPDHRRIGVGIAISPHETIYATQNFSKCR